MTHYDPELWDVDAIQRAEDIRYGWEALQDQLKDDENYARYLFESFHGREY